jgi:hypothetical protein
MHACPYLTCPYLTSPYPYAYPYSRRSGLYKKVYATANELTGFDLKMEGQEDFTIIQYNVNDEYT